MLEDRWPGVETFEQLTEMAEKMLEEDSNAIEEGETESMRHAARLAERARLAEQEEKERLEEEERTRALQESQSDNPVDWLVE